MTELKCNYTNDTLSEDEWYRIENKCKSQHHLQDSDNLKQVIFNDENVLASANITFEQLTDFFEKVKYHYYYQINHNNEYKLSQTESNTISQLNIWGSAWCCWNLKFTKIFKNTIIVGRITWGGAEQCTFQSLEDNKYHGYEYGSHDWIFFNTVTNECMHIGDLLFHQISKHHFFQSPSSKYRVDPLKLISFFQLQPHVNYKSDFVHSYVWKEYGFSSHHTHEPTDSTFNDMSITSYNVDDFKHENFGSNYAYYDDERLFLFVNNKNDQIPKFINDIQLQFSVSWTGFYRCSKTKFTEITNDELQCNWMMVLHS